VGLCPLENRDTAGDGIGECRAGATRLSRLGGGRRGGARVARRPRSQVVAGSPVPRRQEGRGRPSGASPLVSAHSDHIPQPSAGAAALRGSRCSCAGARTAPRRQQARRRRPRCFRSVALDRRSRTNRSDGGVSRGTSGPTSDRLAPRPPLTWRTRGEAAIAPAESSALLVGGSCRRSCRFRGGSAACCSCPRSSCANGTAPDLEPP
jgi:hypothetical protein